MIGVTHHGNNALEPFQAQGFLCWWERVRDLTVTLDRLSMSGPLAAHIDLERVFAAGFSLGGYTVLSLAGAITDVHDQYAAIALRLFGQLSDGVSC